MIRIDRIVIDCRNSQVHFSGTVETTGVLGASLTPVSVVLDEGEGYLAKDLWGNDDAIAAIADHFGILPEYVTIEEKAAPVVEQ